MPSAQRLISVLKEQGLAVAWAKLLHYAYLKAARLGFAFRVKPHGSPLAASWQSLAEAQVFYGQRPSEIGRVLHLAIIGETQLAQCTKYRIEQMAQLAEGLGMRVSIVDHRQTGEAIAALQLASHVMFYRIEAHDHFWMYFYEARRLGLPILYDVDDPVFSIPACNSAYFEAPLALRQHHLEAAPRFLAAMAGCDAVSASTPALAEEVARFLPRPVWLRRNFADAQSLAFGPSEQPEKPGNVLALASGSEFRLMDLVTIVPVLSQFLRAHPDWRLHLIGVGLDPSGLFEADILRRIEQQPVLPYEAYLSQLQNADIVLLPLAEGLHNRCKSAVRAIDAAAVARPVIAQHSGDLAQLIRDGETGILAASELEWAAALEKLSANSALRHEMGRAAYQRLQQYWADPLDPAITAPELSAWLRQ